MFGKIAKSQDTDQGPGSAPRWRARLGLSGKLFGLTIVAIMLAEVIFYVPSIASFRIGWLNDRLAAAHTAAIAEITSDISSTLRE